MAISILALKRKLNGKLLLLRFFFVGYSFLQHFKQKVKDIFIQEWHARLENSTRARFYINIADFKFQTYLDNLTIMKFQQNLTRLRVSSHRLEVACGRWARPERTPLDDRKCKLCHKLEDEYHFILECPLYTDLRKQFISKFYWGRPNMPKFIELCKSENQNVQKRFSMFIEKAFKVRSEAIYS